MNIYIITFAAILAIVIIAIIYWKSKQSKDYQEYVDMMAQAQEELLRSGWK